jgi:RNA polymerase sigma factor (sigma-70 family)
MLPPSCKCSILKIVTSKDFARAYQRDFNFVVRFFMSRGLSHDHAIEYGQAAWVKGWERRKQLRDPSRIMAWIITIGRNLRNTTLRREARELVAGRALVSRQDAGLAVIDAQSILNKCSPPSREILRAHYIEGFTIEEIARERGISKPAATARLMRARNAAKRAEREVGAGESQPLLTPVREESRLPI